MSVLFVFFRLWLIWVQRYSFLPKVYLSFMDKRMDNLMMEVKVA